MTPGARVAAAIEIIDDITAGTPAERVLTAWARNHRFAGSSDRAAIRDHVYDVLRRWRSTAAIGGAETGRGRMIGLLRDAGIPIDSLMTGEGHAPKPPGPTEMGLHPAHLPPAVASDVPDWIHELFTQDLGVLADGVMETLRHRAPVFLRVNTTRIDREGAQAALAVEGIDSALHHSITTALEVTKNERKIQQSQAYLHGFVELQDASSQAGAYSLPLEPGDLVLDYCAGGGGKALALAARGARVVAHDVEPRRMTDLPARADRAGHVIHQIATIDLAQTGPYDGVFVDAPCSGSGTWRRDPAGKWRLSPADLDHLAGLQAEILADAANFVRPGGHLAYATCSILSVENDSVIRSFLASAPNWSRVFARSWLPGPEGDGFYTTVLRRRS